MLARPKFRRILGALLAAALSAESVAQAGVTVQSGSGHTCLLELFTSEGCSSCPPAERWLSAWRQQPQLWKEVVPIAFHVDYWDGLGWRDRFASPAFSARQRQYAAAWRANTVYTPGFVLDGREWQRRDEIQFSPGRGEGGRLSAVLTEKGEVQVVFHAPRRAAPLEAYAALLGFDLAVDIPAGENGGHRLTHDFVVLALASGAMSGDEPRATLRLPAEKVQHGKTALAVWVAEAGKLASIQAAGGEL